jgi:hypothetical protein
MIARQQASGFDGEWAFVVSSNVAADEKIVRFFSPAHEPER